jgi:hypothetical protein
LCFGDGFYYRRPALFPVSGKVEILHAEDYGTFSRNFALFGFISHNCRADLYLFRLPLIFYTNQSSLDFSFRKLRAIYQLFPIPGVFFIRQADQGMAQGHDKQGEDKKEPFPGGN